MKRLMLFILLHNLFLGCSKDENIIWGKIDVLVIKNKEQTSIEIDRLGNCIELKEKRNIPIFYQYKIPNEELVKINKIVYSIIENNIDVAPNKTVIGTRYFITIYNKEGKEIYRIEGESIGNGFVRSDNLIMFLLSKVIKYNKKNKVLQNYSLRKEIIIGLDSIMNNGN